MIETLVKTETKPKEIKIHEFDKWVTDWSVYVGEEDLGKIRICKSRFGMHKSYHEDGRELVMGLELDHCIHGTYWHLKWKRDGYDGYQSSFNGVVGGKL